jgi:hypothetical protein
MTIHLGAVPASSTLYIPFASYGADGQSITLTGLAVTDIEIYKNGSVTQRASDAGYTLLDTDGIDFDGLTGIHGFSVDLSDNTDASFYAVGSFYWVVVSAVTINTQTVNFIAATFRIAPAESAAGYPKADTSHIAGSAVSTSSAQIGVNVVNAAGTAWGSGAITAATFGAGAIDAAAIAADAIGSSELATTAITEITDAILAKAYESTETVGQFMRLTRAVLMGVTSGQATATGLFKAKDGTTTRITATTDADGNRTGIAINAAD